MSSIQSVFSQKKKSVQPYQAFWAWFRKHEKAFFSAVMAGVGVQEKFFEVLSPKLDEIKEGIFYLTGMHDDKTVELVLTPDATVKNIVFVEELVNAAPVIKGWRFTALKPALDIESMNIKMAGQNFNKDNLFFYSNDAPAYPDQIDLTVVYTDFKEDDPETAINGVYIFLDNYIGELASVTTIDSLSVVGPAEAAKELVPIEKLQSFLAWREKEFIEKYQGTRHSTDNDTYSTFEAELESGNHLVAIINTELLEWNRKVSHPWVVSVEIKYDGESTNGMPDTKTYEVLDKIEEYISAKLKDSEGYLNIGRQTANSVREIYFACKDFRLPAKVLHNIQEEYSNKIDIEYDIYKDKYWQSFERFQPSS